jgi:hypothetical protein
MALKDRNDLQFFGDDTILIGNETLFPNHSVSPLKKAALTSQSRNKIADFMALPQRLGLIMDVCRAVNEIGHSLHRHDSKACRKEERQPSDQRYQHR